MVIIWDGLIPQLVIQFLFEIVFFYFLSSLRKEPSSVLRVLARKIELAYPAPRRQLKGCGRESN
uniref:Uncharacterized protein n=1 Tax=Arundo donax TaxID=35708 RepID=A0A0A9GX87_ARUDO